MQLYSDLEHQYPEWLEWEPETIREIPLVQKESGDVDETKFNKVMSLQTTINSQSDELGFHFTDWFIFEKTLLALNGAVPDFQEVEQAEPHEIQGGIYILEGILGSLTFNDEVAKYIAASYKTNNMVYCPFYEDVDKYLEDSPLKEKTKKLWNKVPSNDEAIDKIAETDDTPASVQIKRLLYVREYAKAVFKNAEKGE